MNKILFAGPTLFAPMLKLWNEMIRFEIERNSRKYYTYLILTDGMNHDIDETVEEIVIASRLPVSIIIIGIGDADFTNMQFLDADSNLLFSNISQTFSKRDNVQFVEFNRYKHDLQLLAKETLRELPKQMINYFMSNGITPEDILISQGSQEARDFFSHKAMQYMTNSEFENRGLTETVQSIVQEGIADFESIDVNKCAYSYRNNLKC